MKKCLWCGKWLRNFWKFCPKCGNDLYGITRPTMVCDYIREKREKKLMKELALQGKDPMNHSE
jgi:hypothetical protein